MEQQKAAIFFLWLGEIILVLWATHRPQKPVRQTSFQQGNIGTRKHHGQEVNKVNVPGIERFARLSDLEN